MSSIKTWSKFSVTKGSNSVNLRIVDAPENLLEEVFNLYLKYYVPEEPTLKASGVPNNAAALEELRVAMLKAAQEKGFHTVVCCLDNGDDQIKEIFGASMMTLTTKGDPEPEFDFKTDEMKKAFEIFYGLLSFYDESKAYNTDRYFDDRGMFVIPEYKGLGIEQEFLKVRRLITKEHGIPVSGAWVGTPDAQKACESDGWETVFELKFEELAKKVNATFEGAPPSIKFMIAKIQ